MNNFLSTFLNNYCRSKVLLKTALFVAIVCNFSIPPLFAVQDSKKHLENGLLQIRQHLPINYDASGQCFDVEVDSIGLVYAATNTGVIIFDGANYNLIEHPDKLPVRSLLVGPKGKIYAGFRGDFGEIVSDSRGFLSIKSVLPDSIKQAGVWESWYTEVINDTIYFSSEGFLYRYIPDPKREQDRLKIWNRGENDNDYFINIFECFGKIMISRTHSGLQNIVNDSLVTIYNTPGEILGIKDGIRFDENNYVLSTSFNGLFLWNGKELTEFKSEISNAIKDDYARYMVSLSQNRYAISTSIDGVFVFNQKGRVLHKLDKSVGLSEDKTAFMCADHENGLWISTNYGFCRCDLDNPIQVFNEELGLKGNIYAITRFNNVLYAGSSSGLFKLVPSTSVGKPAHFEQIGEKSSVWDFCHLEDCLIIFSVGQIKYITKDDTTLYNWTDGPLFALASTATEDKKHFFYGMYHNGIGLAKWENNEPFTIIKKIPSGQFPLNMILENNRELWYCADSRMIQRIDLKWENKEITSWEITTYDTSKGLPSSRYRSFAIEGKRYWGGKSGLFSFSKVLDKFIPDSSFGNELAGNSAFDVPEVSPNGDIWFNGDEQSGMRLIKNNDGDYTKEWSFQPIHPKSIAIYYSEDDGITWAGSIGGILYRYDSEQIQSEKLSYKALVRQVAVKGDSVIFGGHYNQDWSTPILTSTENSLRINFSLPRYKNDKHNEYQFRLIGLDEEWSEWSSESYRDFNSLNGGKYTFEVRGRDPMGHISESDLFHFVVLPPWYLTNWMKFLYLLLSTLLIMFIVRLSIRRIEQDRLRLEKLVDEKTAEALEQFERAKAAEIKAKEIEVANQMAATIAHEFNNPLAIIKLSLDTSKMNDYKKEDEIEYHRKIETQVERMKNLVAKLLALEEIRKVDYAAKMKILDIHNKDSK